MGGDRSIGGEILFHPLSQPPLKKPKVFYQASDAKNESGVMHCNKDFYTDNSGVASKKTRNAGNNSGSRKDLNKEIEKIKLMKSLRKMKKIRNITKEYV